MAGLVKGLTKLLCHWTGLEYDTGSSKAGVPCNERDFNWTKGQTMKVIHCMIISKYDHARL